MMNKLAIGSVVILGLSVLGCAGGGGKTGSTTRPSASSAVDFRSLQQRVRPSLVVVRYTYDSEMGRREIEGAGIVMSEDGLVAFGNGIVPSGLPESQMINYKVVVPPGIEGPDEVEYDATFLGRDERANVAYAKVNKVERPWTPLKYADKPLDVGDTIHTVGLLTKGSGYSLYSRTSTVSAKLRGPVPLILTSGNLTAVGSPVFNADGDFVAIVSEQEGQNPMLNPEQNEAASLVNPPIFVVPISDYLPSLKDPPTSPNSRKVPWMGVVHMTGLKKEVAAVYGLNGKAGIQVGDVIPGEAAAEAGLKGGEIITQINGKDLERGDTPEELPVILGRQMTRLNVGDPVTLTIVRAKGSPPEQVTLKLKERPPIASSAERYYAEDLGYTVRDLVFNDRYARRLDADFPGVIVTFVKPQGNAQAGGLARNDVVTKINQVDVKDVKQFQQAYNDFRKASPKEAVVFEVMRGVDTQIIRIQPPQ